MTPDELKAELEMALAIEWSAICALVLCDDERARTVDLAVMRPYIARAFAAGSHATACMYQRALGGRVTQ